MKKQFLVTKSNALINATYNLSSQEQKIILTLASLVEPDDEEFREYVFKIQNFIKLLEIKDKSKYTEVPRITKELMKKVFEIRTGNSIKQLSWLCSVVYKINEGIVILKFSPDLKPYLLHLKSMYTKYRLENILNLKSKYSIRMYEILKCNQFKGECIIELNELKNMVGAVANYFKIYADFKKKVLLQAQKEINAITDISFDFAEIKESRRIVGIKLIIFSNNKKSNTTKDLENEYSDELILKLKNKFESLTKSKITIKKICNLIDLKGTEKVELYLNNYNKFKNNKHNPAGFLIKAITDEYEIPVEEKNNYFNKPVQSTNFDQREYDDDFFESLYDNLNK
jgi:plasmid replication initiation protein